jgi:hypothetical protein
LPHYYEQGENRVNFGSTSNHLQRLAIEVYESGQVALEERSSVSLSAVLITGNSPSPVTQQIGAAEDISFSSSSLNSRLPCVEIFGQSILQRTVANFTIKGIRTTVIPAHGCRTIHKTGGMFLRRSDDPFDAQSELKLAFQRIRKRGSQFVLIGLMGAYVEFDPMAALEFHRSQHQTITPFYNDGGPLGYWIVSLTPATSYECCDVLLNGEELARAIPYKVPGYINRLKNAHNLRQLVVDAFLGRNSITPKGRQLRPGIWVDESVGIPRDVRLVAPTYVGKRTRLKRGAVLTRFSNVERDCSLGEGSVVAYASVLPQTAIGRQLDVSCAVVDGGELADLRRNITLKINDPRLIASTTAASHVPAHGQRHEHWGYRTPERQLEYSHYLARAAGRLIGAFGAFRGEA